MFFFVALSFVELVFELLVFVAIVFVGGVFGVGFTVVVNILEGGVCGATVVVATVVATVVGGGPPVFTGPLTGGVDGFTITFTGDESCVAPDESDT